METNSVIRHVLQLAAGALVTKGYIDAGIAEALVGAALSVGAAVWYWWDAKRKAAQ